MLRRSDMRALRMRPENRSLANRDRAVAGGSPRSTASANPLACVGVDRDPQPVQVEPRVVPVPADPLLRTMDSARRPRRRPLSDVSGSEYTAAFAKLDDVGSAWCVAAFPPHGSERVSPDLQNRVALSAYRSRAYCTLRHLSTRPTPFPRFTFPSDAARRA